MKLREFARAQARKFGKSTRTIENTVKCIFGKFNVTEKSKIQKLLNNADLQADLVIELAKKFPATIDIPEYYRFPIMEIYNHFFDNPNYNIISNGNPDDDYVQFVSHDGKESYKFLASDDLTNVYQCPLCKPIYKYYYDVLCSFFSPVDSGKIVTIPLDTIYALAYNKHGKIWDSTFEAFKRDFLNFLEVLENWQTKAKMQINIKTSAGGTVLCGKILNFSMIEINGKIAIKYCEPLFLQAATLKKKVVGIPCKYIGKGKESSQLVRWYIMTRIHLSGNKKNGMIPKIDALTIYRRTGVKFGEKLIKEYMNSMVKLGWIESWNIEARNTDSVESFAVDKEIRPKYKYYINFTTKEEEE